MRVALAGALIALAPVSAHAVEFDDPHVDVTNVIDLRCDSWTPNSNSYALQCPAGYGTFYRAEARCKVSRFPDFWVYGEMRTEGVSIADCGERTAHDYHMFIVSPRES